MKTKNVDKKDIFSNYLHQLSIFRKYMKYRRLVKCISDLYVHKCSIHYLKGAKTVII
jgi:hypothetical protein